MESFLTQCKACGIILWLELWTNWSSIKVGIKWAFLRWIKSLRKNQVLFSCHQQNLKKKYQTKVCPLTFYGMTSTLRELWKNKKLPNVPLNCKEQESFTTAFLKSKKPSRLAYQKLVELKCNYKISSQEKCSKVFPEARDLIWQNSYMTAFKCTKSTNWISV